jgi:3-oxoacyl-[acyl-carrier protein] reductase
VTVLLCPSPPRAAMRMVVCRREALDRGDVQGVPLAEMSVADLERPIVTAVRTMLITSRAAARLMTRRGSGVILVSGG